MEPQKQRQKSKLRSLKSPVSWRELHQTVHFTSNDQDRSSFIVINIDVMCNNTTQVKQRQETREEKRREESFLGSLVKDWTNDEDPIFTFSLFFSYFLRDFLCTFSLGKFSSLLPCKNAGFLLLIIYPHFWFLRRADIYTHIDI